MTHPTDALRLVPHEKVRELAMQLARSIAGLGYPVGLGVAPPEDVCMKAAQGIFDLYLTAAPASPLPEGGGWRTDFENVPKDGSVFLIAYDDEAARKGRLYDNSERVYEARWNEVGETWSARNGFIRHPAATHWMPLPAAPTGDARNGKGEG